MSPKAIPLATFENVFVAGKECVSTFFERLYNVCVSRLNVSVDTIRTWRFAALGPGPSVSCIEAQASDDDEILIFQSEKWAQAWTGADMPQLGLEHRDPKPSTPRSYRRQEQGIYIRQN